MAPKVAMKIVKNATAKTRVTQKKKSLSNLPVRARQVSTSKSQRPAKAIANGKASASRVAAGKACEAMAVAAKKSAKKDLAAARKAKDLAKKTALKAEQVEKRKADAARAKEKKEAERARAKEFQLKRKADRHAVLEAGTKAKLERAQKLAAFEAEAQEEFLRLQTELQTEMAAKETAKAEAADLDKSSSSETGLNKSEGVEEANSNGTTTTALEDLPEAASLEERGAPLASEKVERDAPAAKDDNFVGEKHDAPPAVQQEDNVEAHPCAVEGESDEQQPNEDKTDDAQKEAASLHDRVAESSGFVESQAAAQYKEKGEEDISDNCAEESSNSSRSAEPSSVEVQASHPQEDSTGACVNSEA